MKFNRKKYSDSHAHAVVRSIAASPHDRRKNADPVTDKTRLAKWFSGIGQEA
jgi:hypothetical protein